MQQLILKQTLIDGWMKRAQEEAKKMVNKVEQRLQELERKSKDGTTKTKSVTQKVDQQELKMKYVMKVSKEHTVRLNSQSEEIVKLGKSHEKLDTKVDSVK